MVGEAEDVWTQVLADAERGTLHPCYRGAQRPDLAGLRPDRTIFRGKRYLPIGLVEAGRGCHFRCDFCAVQTVFNRSQTRRPVDDILEEVAQQRGKPLIFFVDDNITSNRAQAKEFFHELAKLKVHWVSQASINAAHDEEFLELIAAGGCQGVLIGFESLEPENLRRMNKSFNLMAHDMNKRAGRMVGYADLGTAKAALTRRFRRWVGPRLFPICPYACSVLTVMQNGDVPLCGNDWRHLEIIGNARQDSPAAIYNSPRMQEVRRMMAAGRYDEIASCRECSFRQEWLREGRGQHER